MLTAMIGYSNRFLRLDMTSSMAILFRECEGGGNIFNLCQCVHGSTFDDYGALIGPITEQKVSGELPTLFFWPLSFGLASS